MSKRLFITTLVILALAGSCAQIHHLKALLRQSRVESATLALRAQDFHPGEVKRDPALTVPSLTSQVKAASKGGAITAATARTVYQRVEVPFQLPCDSASNGTPPGALQNVGTSAQEATFRHTLSLSADHQLALSLTPDGKPWWASRLFVDAAIDHQESQRVELRADTLHSTFTLSPDISKAIDEWTSRPPRLSWTPRPLKRWRVGWSLGPTVTYNLDGRVALGVGVLFGLQL